MKSDIHFKLQQTDNHICVEFNSEYPVLSSAVLNGGCQTASRILIMKVGKTLKSPETITQSPESTLMAYCRRLQFGGLTVGMMTAASLDSFRLVSKSSQGVTITVMVTAGISNARCAGDRAEWRKIRTDAPPTGTINTIILTNAAVTGAARVESVMLAAESKAVAFRGLGVKSPVSGATATGTGTDSIAVANGLGPDIIRYCGKHVLFGELLASAVIEAITESLRSRI